MNTRYDYDAAVRAYWAGRDLQAQKQIDAGRIDAGLRGSATGGKHLDPLQELIAAQFAPLEAIGAEIRYKGVLPVPGYFRRAKNWDIVVTLGGDIIAAVECKSQNGPSFGNNFNNRTEEAIGNAVDLRRAYDSGLIGKRAPWLGFVMILERASGSLVAVRDHGTAMRPTAPEFNDTSYTDRYALLLDSLVDDGLYDATCLISSARGEGIALEPWPSLSTETLTASISEFVADVLALP